MTNENATLTPKKAQAIANLLQCSTITEAATRTGVAKITLLRWLKDPDFDTAYREARTKIVKHALAQLQSITSDAVDTLKAVMADPKATDSTRARAAKAMIETSMKAHETEVLEARLSALEAQQAAYEEAKAKSYGYTDYRKKASSGITRYHQQGQYDTAESPELTGKKKQAMENLLECDSIERAAAYTGVSKNTLLKWLKDPDFATAYREARTATVRHSIAQIQATTADAVDTLKTIMADPEAAPSCRAMAARTVLDTALKAMEMEALEARIATLEAIQRTRTR